MSTSESPIRHVTTDDPVSAVVTSATTKELERRLGRLSTAVRSMSASAGSAQIVLTEKPIDPTLDISDRYSLVHWDRTNGYFTKAQARAMEKVAGGYELTADSYAAGILTTVDSSSATGTVLVSGVLTDDSVNTIADSMLEEGQQLLEGIPYYLSETEAGKITGTKPTIAVQVLMVVGDEIVFLPNYSSLESFDRSQRFEVGMEALGKYIYEDNETKIYGFPGLEDDGTGDFISTNQSGHLMEDTGFIVADAALDSEPLDEMWVQIHVAKTTGVVTCSTYYSIPETASSATEVQSISTTIAPDSEGNVVFHVDGTTYDEVQELLLIDNDSTEIGSLWFKFTSSDLTADRYAIFKVPYSFKGWKNLTTVVDDDADGNSGFTYAITESGGSGVSTDSYDLDYPEFGDPPNKPSTVSHLYYNSKADPTFRSIWPARPLGRAIFMLNGVELKGSTMVENGEASTFEDSDFSVGYSEQTLYWASAHNLAQPFDYRTMFYQEDTDAAADEAARLWFPSQNVGEAWFWWSDLAENEPYVNAGFGYGNKLSTYYGSQMVANLTTGSGLNLRDNVTGLDISSSSASSGNVEIYQDEGGLRVSEMTEAINLLPSVLTSSVLNPSVAVFHNTTGKTVVIEQIIVAGTVVTNITAGPSINLGTGAYGSGNESNVLAAQALDITDTNDTEVLVQELTNKALNPGEKYYLRVSALPAFTSGGVLRANVVVRAVVIN